MDTKINFLNHKFKNPIVPASGTFGFGYEFAAYYDINILRSIWRFMSLTAHDICLSDSICTLGCKT